MFDSLIADGATLKKVQATFAVSGITGDRQRIAGARARPGKGRQRVRQVERLAQVVRDAVAGRFDRRAFERVLAAEKQARVELLRRLG